MNKMSAFLKVLVIFSLLQLFILTVTAQEKIDNTVLTNNDVIELVKSGLSESIILTKIKNSKCEFDTSSSKLVKLKENGISDSIINAMIEQSKPKEKTSATIDDISADSKAGIDKAIGKMKVIIFCEDENSRIVLTENFQKSGYAIVKQIEEAEMIITFTSKTKSVKFSTYPGIGGGGGLSSNAEYELGNLKVYVQESSTKILIYEQEKSFIIVGKILSKQADDFSTKFIKEVKKVEKSNNKRQ